MWDEDAPDLVQPRAGAEAQNLVVADLCRPAPGLGFRIWALDFRVQDLGLRVWGSGLGLEV